MDFDLVLLVVIVAFSLLLLVVLWRYVETRSKQGQLEQEQELFGHGLTPETRALMATLMASVMPRFSSSKGFFAAVIVCLLLWLGTVLGYL